MPFNSLSDTLVYLEVVDGLRAEAAVATAAFAGYSERTAGTRLERSLPSLCRAGVSRVVANREGQDVAESCYAARS